MVERWERAVNILTEELSGDERWCYPCWIQSEPAQGSSSPQRRQGTIQGTTIQHSFNCAPKTNQKIAKLEIYFCKNRKKL